MDRIEILNNGSESFGPVVYLITRELRAKDNFALSFAEQIAKDKGVELICMYPWYDINCDLLPGIQRFVAKGLISLGENLNKNNIALFIIPGSLTETLPKIADEISPTAIITDFYPLRHYKYSNCKLKEKVDCSIYEVDSHNIIPCKVASNKQEYSARTFRQKIKNLLIPALSVLPLEIKMHKPAGQLFYLFNNYKVELSAVLNKYCEDEYIFESGETAADSVLYHFIENKLSKYHQLRNNPAVDGQSNLSPYLNFGMISARRIANKVIESEAPQSAKDAFLEELAVRRELSDNYCYYNSNYDNYEGLPNWAKNTLDARRNDKRDYTYTSEEFENAQTHDILWNAAQFELTRTGKMHGYMRMYWAKKILEWTANPESAIETAVYLNDKFSLDGRDPNGYCGILWSIGGLHDRPWFNRPVFGMVRYMSRSGIEKKFPVKKYINKFSAI